MSSWRKVLKSKTASLEIDLVELFGAEVPDDSGFRQSVGQRIIDLIRERTAENKDVDGSPFKKYSKEYKESLDFAAYGKSAGDVNLKLTGTMLNELDIIKETKDRIVIGWVDREEAAKAYNHVTGDTVKKRDFLGLRPGEEKILRDEFFEDVMETRDQAVTVSSVSRANEFLAGGLTFGENESLNSILDRLFGEE